MPLTNTRDSYGSVTKTLHWLTALLIITLIPLGIIAHDMGFDTPEQLTRKAWLFSLHKTLGVTVFFVALARIAWALRQIKPGGLHPERKMESWAAETVHWLLYGSLILVPLTGWIHHAATTGFAPIWWPFGQSLPFVPKDEGVSELFSSLHMVFERVLAASLILHIAGALKHHFIDKDVTLRRMWFGASNTPATSGTHSRALPLVSALIAWGIAISIGSAIGVFERHEKPPLAQPQLEQAQTDWAVQSGEIKITISQFGNDVTGSFSDWTAAIIFDPETGTGSVETIISIPSLTLGSVTAQAMGGDYFDATTFPTAIFKAAITPVVDGYSANGTLKIRDQEVPLDLPFGLNIIEDTADLRTSLTLDRRDFGIGDNMSDESSLKFAVKIDITLTATGQP